MHWARERGSVPISIIDIATSCSTHDTVQVPRVIRKALLALGAEEFHESKEADEVDGLEDVVEAWSESLWEPLITATTPKVL